MEQVLLGIVLFNAFFMPSNFQFDTLELSQIQMNQNQNAEFNLGNEFKMTESMAIGSREYNQANSWLRYGHGTYLYSHKSETKDKQRKLNHYGGYAGFLAEIHYQKYIGLGILVGGGASYTEFNNPDLSKSDRSNYFGLASPYITLGLPYTNTASINLTASSYFLSGPSEQIDGVGEGFETPRNLESKIGFEFVWSWN